MADGSVTVAVLTSDELLKSVSIYEELEGVPDVGALQHALEMMGWFVSDIHSPLSQRVFERILGRPPGDKLQLTQGEFISYVAHIKTWYVLRKLPPGLDETELGTPAQPEVDRNDMRAMNQFFEVLLNKEPGEAGEEHGVFESRVGAGSRTSSPGGPRGRWRPGALSPAEKIITPEPASPSPVGSPRAGAIVVRRLPSESKWWVVIRWFQDRLAARQALQTFWKRQGGELTSPGGQQSPRGVHKAIEQMQLNVASGETKYALLKRRLLHSSGRPVDRDQERLRRQLLKKRRKRGIRPGGAAGDPEPTSPLCAVRHQQQQSRITDPCVAAGCGTDGTHPGVHEMLYHMSYDLDPEAESAALSRQLFANYLKRSARGGRYDFEQGYVPPGARGKKPVEKLTALPRVATLPQRPSSSELAPSGGTLSPMKIQVRQGTPTHSSSTPSARRENSRRPSSRPISALGGRADRGVSGSVPFGDCAAPALFAAHAQREFRRSFYDDMPEHPAHAATPLTKRKLYHVRAFSASVPAADAASAAADSEPSHPPAPVVPQAQMDVWVQGSPAPAVAKRPLSAASHRPLSADGLNVQRPKDYTRFGGKTRPSGRVVGLD
eukprot:TRINITY_DN28131_c0_g1_i1.p1 TRINITY_DN28131_c0_g1~~TRINITY_DN28131_c0_g1_i1.p1  ORF type:complete len:648 (+),score=112.35 TRINITY_DN28131_c0_g1_i1:125-1945(+)